MNLIAKTHYGILDSSGVGIAIGTSILKLALGAESLALTIWDGAPGSTESRSARTKRYGGWIAKGEGGLGFEPPVSLSMSVPEEEMFGQGTNSGGPVGSVHACLRGSADPAPEDFAGALFCVNYSAAAGYGREFTVIFFLSTGSSILTLGTNFVPAAGTLAWLAVNTKFVGAVHGAVFETAGAAAVSVGFGFLGYQGNGDWDEATAERLRRRKETLRAH